MHKPEFQIGNSGAIEEMQSGTAEIALGGARKSKSPRFAEGAKDGAPAPRAELAGSDFRGS
jgi:hypothetical protein